VDKRYQVFVSSTFQDLELERQEVMHALLELDCIPSGMELFPAANESQWNLIQKVIDDCDYYILILGGRYGTIGPDGYSYTEMEYRYALSSGKPIIAFIHGNPGSISSDKSEASPEGKPKLEAFRKEVEKRLVKKWSNPQDLGSVVSRSLIQLIKSTPAVGWVRANELADRDATTELLRLRRQVDELQAELNRVRISAPGDAEGLAKGDELHSISYRFQVQELGTYRSTSWTSDFEASWDQVFGSVAPIMINEASDLKVRDAINSFIAAECLEKQSEDPQFAGRRIHSFQIRDTDFDTIKVQLRALGLITQSQKNRSVKDSGTYWTLTPYGDSVMTRLRAIRRSGHTEAGPPIVPTLAIEDEL